MHSPHKESPHAHGHQVCAQLSISVHLNPCWEAPVFSFQDLSAKVGLLVSGSMLEACRGKEGFWLITVRTLPCHFGFACAALMCAQQQATNSSGAALTSKPCSQPRWLQVKLCRHMTVENRRWADLCAAVLARHFPGSAGRVDAVKDNQRPFVCRYLFSSSGHRAY